MIRILQFLIFVFVSMIRPQVDYSNNWEDFYSYHNAKDFIKIDDKIYAIVDNALFTYDTSTDEMQKISSVNGLSGETTTSLHYSFNFEKIVVGYETGLLEIIDRNNVISIAKDIENFNFSGSKQINDIIEYNDKLYLSTSFAVVVFDIENLQFGDTYFIGNQSSEIRINQIRIYENLIYAATEEGVYMADLSNPNLIDFNNWTQLSTGNFAAIEVFNNRIFVAKDRILYHLNNGILSIQKTYANLIVSLKASHDFLTISTLRNFYINDTDDSEIINYVPNSADQYYANINTAYYEGDNIFIGTQEFGILKNNVQNGLNFEEIHPDGPFTNAPFSIAANNTNLWVVYGSYSASYNPGEKRYGFSHFNGENWINKPYDASVIRDLVRITIDPYRDNRVFLSSWSDGMLIVENDVITEHWNHTNSGLEKLDFINPYYVSTRINGSAFDNQGNLWIANAWVDERVKKYSEDGNWSSFDMSTVMTNPALGLNELIIDKTNNIWIGSRRNGVLVFSENGNRKRALTTEPTKGSLPDLNVRTLKSDNSNRIWLGTKKGLVVFFNAASVFDQNTVDAEPIIILDDGIPKKLLGDQQINTIAIDGADNKWFGTETGGVLNNNPNETVTLQNFNKNNSPLPSNNILKIDVDHISGKVYFATDKGIVVYNSNVASYGESLPEVYAYPNPSTRSNEVITIDGRSGTHLPKGTNLKILDTAGNLVYETTIKEGQELSGGKVTWNKVNLAGTKVASGVYIVLLTAKEGNETTFMKIAIIN